MNEGGEAFQRLLLEAQEVKDRMDSHEEVLDGIANSEKTVVKKEARFEEPMPQWERCPHDCALRRRACPYGKQKAMVSS